jgi:hypothetical protein
MVLVAVLERREETRLGCRLIDLIGEKEKILLQLASCWPIGEKQREVLCLLVALERKKDRGCWRIDLFGKKKRNYCSLLIAARWEKRGGPKFCGWLARADHGWEKAAGCGRGAEEENSWLLQLA